MNLIKAILGWLNWRSPAPTPADIPAFLTKPAPTMVELGIVEPTIDEPAAPESGQALQPTDPAPEPTILKEQDMRNITINAVTYYADRASVNLTINGQTVNLATDKTSAAAFEPGSTFVAPEAADTQAASTGSGSIGGTIVAAADTTA